MIPMTTAISASIPLPIDLTPGLAPVLILLAFLAVGMVDMTRAVLTARRTARSQPQPVRRVMEPVSRVRVAPPRRAAA